MIHQLKIQEAFAEAILRGEKTFEVRVNDRGFQKGDHVIFNVIDQAGNSVEHPLIGKEYKITYVLSGWGIQNGYVVFGIQECCDCIPF